MVISNDDPFNSFTRFYTGKAARRGAYTFAVLVDLNNRFYQLDFVPE